MCWSCALHGQLHRRVATLQYSLCGLHSVAFVICTAIKQADWFHISDRQTAAKQRHTQKCLISCLGQRAHCYVTDAHMFGSPKCTPTHVYSVHSHAQKTCWHSRCVGIAWRAWCGLHGNEASVELKSLHILQPVQLILQLCTCTESLSISHSHKSYK